MLRKARSTWNPVESTVPSTSIVRRGSARRLRRFFYAGMAGVILAALGQLLNALQEVNQWITFGLIGLILVLLAIIVERKLEAIKAWQQVLETWE